MNPPAGITGVFNPTPSTLRATFVVLDRLFDNMRLVIALLVLFGGFVGYGAYRQHQVTLAQRARAAALQDSLRRADSLQRVAEAQAAAAREAAARQAAIAAAQSRTAEHNRQRYESDAMRQLKLPKPERRVVYIRKPVRTNRQR